MNYRLTDRYLDPPEHQSLNSEQLLYLNCFLCYKAPEKSPDITKLPVETNGFITFGSFNSFAKINEHTIELWSKILQQLPTAKLILKSSSRPGHSAQTILSQQFKKYTINPERITYLDFAPDTTSHLEHYHQIDIALDTFPYNGMTTTCEALWMGVPVLTLKGSRHFSRASSSILNTIELSEWIAENEEQYIHQAIHIQDKLNELKTLRQTLRSKMLNSYLCNAREFMNDLENLYKTIWKKWCKET